MGSSFEGTRLDNLDEFDFNFELVRFRELFYPVLFDQIGFYNLKLNFDRCKGDNISSAAEDFRNFYDYGNFLMENRVNMSFKTVLKQMLHDSAVCDSENSFEVLYVDNETEFTSTPDKTYLTLKL